MDSDPGPDERNTAEGPRTETGHSERSRAEDGGRVLVVDDDETMRTVLLDILTEAGYEVETVADGEAALRAIHEGPYDLVLLDLHLPKVSGLNVLSALPSVQTDARFVVMTAFGTVDSAVEAMKLGAFDYLRKPFQEGELLLVAQRAIEDVRLRREVARLRRATAESGLGGMVGRSPAMKRLFRMIERVAPTRATVLVTGETGTGKELVAAAIHELSDRARKPFVAVNCSALPDTLLESELFGHMKGSFTGAIASRRGLVEEAMGGTLFLDEISTLSEDIQVKLLRVLQDRKVQRIGSRSPTSVDFRLIAATNQDLRKLVDEGAFREDLYYRLDVFPIEVPPLRERREDITLLANHFRLRFAERNGVEPPGLGPEILARMTDYDWPGNVRELENFIERSVIMYSGEKTIPFGLGRDRSAAEDSRMVQRAVEEEWTLERLEREYILATLDRTRWQQSLAADLLGVHRRTIYRKLKQYREEGYLPDLPEVTRLEDGDGD